MKNLLLLFAALFFSVTSFAQSAQEEVDLIQSMYGMQKKQIVANFIKLEGAQKDAFWKLYDAYEVERKALGIKRINLLGMYAENYGTLDDAKIDAMVKEMNSLGVKNDKLIGSYYGKMKKPAGVKAAAQFTQIEYYLLSTIRAEILEEIPFIGELD
jgi:Spy/CpxP family protein refolding chaperone